MSILHRYLDRLADAAARPSQIVQLLDQVTPVGLALLPVLCHDTVVSDHLQRYHEVWRHIQPELTGNDLRRMGIARGVIYRNILTALRVARLDGEIHSRTQEEATAKAMAALT